MRNMTPQASSTSPRLPHDICLEFQLAESGPALLALLALLEPVVKQCQHCRKAINSTPRLPTGA